jgi:predicted LPLAT superfamily acyltransferase
MSQEISVSYQAVKSKIYRLIDAAVEGEKTEAQVLESLERWWKLIHPADRAVAQKYLQRILERSHASLNAMTHALSEAAAAPSPDKLGKADGHHASMARPI